jgi:hypothetical protein
MRTHIPRERSASSPFGRLVTLLRRRLAVALQAEQQRSAKDEVRPPRRARRSTQWCQFLHHNVSIWEVLIARGYAFVRFRSKWISAHAPQTLWHRGENHCCGALFAGGGGEGGGAASRVSCVACCVQPVAWRHVVAAPHPSSCTTLRRLCAARHGSSVASHTWDGRNLDVACQPLHAAWCMVHGACCMLHGVGRKSILAAT